MEKKNTILLTVIAVATLLVAIIGATFAYYSVQVTNPKTQVNVNATAGSIAVLTLSTPTPNLYLNVVSSDMAQFEEDKSYFAVKTSKEDLTSNYATQKQNHIISQLSVGDGGDENTTYTCKAQLKITLTTTDGSMGKVLQSGDAKLYLVGSNITFEESLVNNEIDISSLLTEPTEDSKVKTYDITYEVDGKTKKQATISADIELINKSNSKDGDQSYLAGKNLTIAFEVVTSGDNLDCSIGKISGE